MGVLRIQGSIMIYSPISMVSFRRMPHLQTILVGIMMINPLDSGVPLVEETQMVGSLCSKIGWWASRVFDIPRIDLPLILKRLWTAGIIATVLLGAFNFLSGNLVESQGFLTAYSADVTLLGFLFLKMWVVGTCNYRSRRVGKTLEKIDFHLWDTSKTGKMLEKCTQGCRSNSLTSQRMWSLQRFA